MIAEQAGLNVVASKSVKGNVTASLTHVDIDAALEAILRSEGLHARREGTFLYVGTPEDFQRMENTLDKVATRIYRPNYVTAAELQSLITPMLTVAIGSISVSTPAEVGMTAGMSGAGGDNFAGGDVLMVRDYEAVLAQIDQVVDEVDRRPLQVAIEAMILSVKLDDSHSMGVDFALLLNETDGLGIPNSLLVSGTPLQSLENLSTGDGGLKFGFLDSRLDLFITALETVGDTNVVASPHLMCLNKQPAEILIGSQLGYVSTTVTESAATQ
jgi:type IV pilus assembly protein PilQ